MGNNDMKFFNLDPKVIRRWDYLKFLATANNVHVKKIVEVGTWDGKNAKKLRKLFPDAHLYLVDPYLPYPSYLSDGFPISITPEKYEKFYQEVCEYFKEDPKTTMIRAPSLEGIYQAPDNLDLVFIDGDHSYKHAKQDILAWQPKMRPGGLLTGHDFSPAYPGVMQAVEECFPNRFVVGKDQVWATIT